VTLESEDKNLVLKRDGTTVSFSRDFTWSSTDYTTQGFFPVHWDLSKVDQIDEASTAKADIDNCAAVWHYVQLNRMVAKIDGYDLPWQVTVSAFDPTPVGTSYSLKEKTIRIEPGDMVKAPLEFKKNRESHEFGHALMHAILEGGWIAKPSVANHGGYINSNSGDSLSEGFAEYWAMHVDRVAVISGDPGEYDAWGHVGSTDRRMAWTPVDIAHPSAPAINYPKEEFAVAGLLWNLEDAIGFARIVKALAVDGTVTSFHAKLLGAGVKESVLGPLFISYGFFADKDGDWKYDKGEPIGAGNGTRCVMLNPNGDTQWPVPKRPTRQKRPYEPNAFVGVNLNGVTSPTAESVVTVRISYPGSPAKDYSYKDVILGPAELVYVDLEPGATAHVTATGPSGDVSPDALDITYSAWVAARSLVASGAAVTATFDVGGGGGGPSITSFLPIIGMPGTAVTITGYGFSGATAVTFNGTAAESFDVVSGTQITATVPADATTGPLAVTTPDGTGTSVANFTVTLEPVGPAVALFSPLSGPAGTLVTVVGYGFSGATAVTFNGAAASFDVVSGTLITATVPAGATTGPLAVTTPDGTGTSTISFTVTGLPTTPKITKLQPASGKRGATVTISGIGFGKKSGASSVKFGTTKCPKYLSWSDTKITCKVPAKAKFGNVKVTVTTAAGRSNAKTFKVKR
jgi:hypothetical protein